MYFFTHCQLEVYKVTGEEEIPALSYVCLGTGESNYESSSETKNETSTCSLWRTFIIGRNHESIIMQTNAENVFFCYCFTFHSFCYDYIQLLISLHFIHFYIAEHKHCIDNND